jgi:SAM-dependent methyltransferase
MLPKDAQEINRLDMQHYILHKAFQANFLAPIQNVRTILDIGSGTGRWVKEMSEYAPYITVHGFDLDLSTLPLPTNCSFTRGNILNGLPYSNDSFDFVHQRLLVLGLPFHTWPGVVQEIVRVTRQGSWVELVECDLHFSHQGTYTRDFIGWLDQASKQRGIDIGIGQKIKSFLEAAGLVHIEEHTKELPLGNWGNHLGKMLLSDFRAAAKQTIKPIIINSLHIDPIHL